MSERTDEALLQRVTRQRDESAFAELMSRHNQAAYSLAMHLVADANMAEEIVQESMLAVWVSARKIKEDSPIINARAWILKIVARQAFKRLRKRQSQRREVQLVAKHCEQQHDRPEPARTELIDTLRRRLLGLSEEDRQLIALHFGGGLSQDEMSRELAIPQRTISYRINKVLQDLRGALTRAGFGSAAAALSGDTLQAALSGGHPAPATLCFKVVEQLKTTDSMRRAAVAKVGASKALTTTVVCFTLLAAGAGYALSQRQAGATQPVAAVGPSTTLPAAIVPVAQSVPFSFQWTFPKDFNDDDFKAIVGSVKKDMLLENNAHVLIDKVLPDQPLLITATLEFGKPSQRIDFGMGMADAQTHEVLELENSWIKRNVSRNTRQFVSRMYVLGERTFLYTGSDLEVVCEYKRPVNARKLYVGGINARVVKLEASTLQPDQIPAALKRPLHELTRQMATYDLGKK